TSHIPVDLDSPQSVGYSDVLTGVMMGFLSTTRDAIVSQAPRVVARLQAEGDPDRFSSEWRENTSQVSAEAPDLVKAGAPAPEDGSSDIAQPNVGGVYDAVQEVWRAWQAMHSGTNTPLTRSVTGNVVFDINVDGVAHYGMLPDLLQDLKNIGISS